MNIRMIVTDLDDTLLRSDKTVSDYTVKVLQACRDRGIKIVYATARSDSAAMMVPAELFDGKITTNGALAYASDEVVYSRLIQPECLRSFLAVTSQRGLRTAAQASGKHYANFNISEVWNWLHNYSIIDFETLSVPIEKAYVLVDSPEDIAFLASQTPSGLYMTVSRDGMAQFMHAEATKACAVTALASHLEIDIQEVVALGDDLNDIDMLNACGVSVAMDNALPEVKAVANQICGTNDEDGVARWLAEHLSLSV